MQNDTLREKRTKMMSAEDERHELEKIQAEHIVYVEKLQDKHDEDTLSLRRAVGQEKKRVNQLQEENERMRDNTQVGAVQKKLTKAEKTLAQRNNEIRALKDKLDVGTEELAKVAEKFVDLEDNFNEQLESRVKAESRKIDALEQRLQRRPSSPSFPSESARQGNLGIIFPILFFVAFRSRLVNLHRCCRLLGTSSLRPLGSRPLCHRHAASGKAFTINSSSYSSSSSSSI